MFRRKPKERTTEEAPDSIAPWEMLEDAEIATATARLRAHFPKRFLVAFARRLDQDTLACFDKGADGTGKSVITLTNWSKGEAAERLYSGFSQWFDAALADHRSDSSGRS